MKNFETHDDIDDGKVEHMHRDYEDDTQDTGQACENAKRSDDFSYEMGLQNGMESDIDIDFSFGIE